MHLYPNKSDGCALIPRKVASILTGNNSKILGGFFQQSLGMQQVNEALGKIQNNKAEGFSMLSKEFKTNYSFSHFKAIAK